MIFLSKIFGSSIGRKIVVATTGILMALFLVGHMIGNSQIFAGAPAINKYAEALHAHPSLIYTFRIGMLTFLLLHVILAIWLTLKNWAARPQSYKYNNTVQASFASRTMIWTGLLILTFIVYHILHFTSGHIHSQFFKENLPKLNGEWNVYAMVTQSFSSWTIAGAYAFFMIALALHLYHGIESVFQTYGWVKSDGYGSLRWVSIIFMVIVVGGLVSVPLFFVIKSNLLK